MQADDETTATQLFDTQPQWSEHKPKNSETMPTEARMDTGTVR